ncbi:hypothetical protein ACD661_11105 [Legionella lytica]|uniref:Substrate of the Dot/Icm secretion system n=1 Tax=Legionella lytica TaxID=96232 RepID=A0ABW8D8S1_9GAMM
MTVSADLFSELDDFLILHISTYLGEENPNELPTLCKRFANVLEVNKNYLKNLTSRLDKLREKKEAPSSQFSPEEIAFIYENEEYFNLLKEKGLHVQLALFYPLILNDLLTDEQFMADFLAYGQENKKLLIGMVDYSQEQCEISLEFKKNIYFNIRSANNLEKLLFSHPSIKERLAAESLVIAGKTNGKLAHHIWNDGMLKAKLPFRERLSNTTLSSVIAGRILGYLIGMFSLPFMLCSSLKNDAVQAYKSGSKVEMIAMAFAISLLLVSLTILTLTWLFFSIAAGLIVGIGLGTLYGTGAGILTGLLLPLAFEPTREAALQGFSLGGKGFGVLLENWTDLLFDSLKRNLSLLTVKDMATSYSEEMQRQGGQPVDTTLTEVKMVRKIGFFATAASETPVIPEEELVLVI